MSLDKLIRERDKRKLERSLIEYTKYAFLNKNKKEFLINWHHQLIAEKLEAVFRGEIQNIIINIAPRYSKTEIAVKCFSEWAMAKTSGRCKFIHLSYSDMLALDNSAEILEDMKSPWYQKFWPIKGKKGKDAKGFWETEAGGEYYATSTLGQITGFGAGEVDSESFSGAIIIDDPLKPEESLSGLMRQKANERLVHTIMSRRNDSRRTPIIIIMQRLHEDDMSGFCLSGQTGEHFEHLNIPAINEDGTALWPLKHTIEQLRQMQTATANMFAGQYMQNPIAGSGNLFTKEMFEFGPVPLECDYSYITVDTAYTDKQDSDGHAMMSGKILGDKLYIDKIYNKQIKAEDAEKETIGFVKSSNQYGFRGAYIEPKGHGIYLNQVLPKKGIYMPPESDLKEFFKDRRLNKTERANNVLPYLSNRKIIINENIIGKEDFLQEVITFPRGKHDDLTDCLIDMIKLVYSKEGSIFDAL